ncbi:uncharacterized protein [Diadema antillarum]|uniref:uncharacterized protein n=1 Tax=Diadema antillarum TaxID=105358 RepID=UPI003A8B75B8
MEGGHSQGRQHQGNFFHQPRLPYYQIKPNYYKPHHRQHGHRWLRDHGPTNATTFDTKRLKNNLLRRTVDYNASIIRYLQTRVWQRDYRDTRWIQPDFAYVGDLNLPHALLDNPINAVTTRFVRTSTNKVRCPIFCVVWTPEGRRLVTGASSGEFTLWNGLTFNFETILQAHEYAVRTMTWSHNDMWLLTGDDLGYVKYWQSNMNNVQMYQAHKNQAVRCASFAPFDSKFCSCSDDGTVRIWDFLRCHEERILRGHGADVRCVEWHPHKGIVVSGSKDSQQPVKLWDPRSGEALATLHAHKSTVMSAKWNMNGNWLLTASRDHLCKLFDIRMMKEMNTFRGHKKEATAIAWHPVHENLFVSGGSDGGILFWQVGNEKEVGGIEEAHESIIWSLAWHPLGHMLCSGSNDHTTKFWTRNRPGDKMRDRYNLNTLPIGTSEDLLEYDDDTTSLPVIPGMGLEFGVPEHMRKEEPVVAPVVEETLDTSIPGLDSSIEELEQLKPKPQRKVPYARPVPQTFQEEWEANKAPGVAPNIEEERRKKREEEERKKKEEEEKKRAEEEKKRKEMDLKRAKEKADASGLVNIPDFGGNPIEVIKFIARTQGQNAAREALVNVIQANLPAGTVLPILKPNLNPINVLHDAGHIPPDLAAKLKQEGFLPADTSDNQQGLKQQNGSRGNFNKDKRSDRPLPARIAALPIAVPPPKQEKKAPAESSNNSSGPDGKTESAKKVQGEPKSQSGAPSKGLLGEKPKPGGLLPDPGSQGGLLPQPKPAGLLPSPGIPPTSQSLITAPPKEPLLPTVDAQPNVGQGDVDLRKAPLIGDVDMRQAPDVKNPLLEQPGGPAGGSSVRPMPGPDGARRNGPIVRSGEDRDERFAPSGGGDVDFRQEKFGDKDMRQSSIQRFNGPTSRVFESQQAQDVDSRFPVDSTTPGGAPGKEDEDLRRPPLLPLDGGQMRTRESQDQDFRQGGPGFANPARDFDERSLPLQDHEEFPPLPHRKRTWEEGPGTGEEDPGFMGGDVAGGRGGGMMGRGSFGPGSQMGFRGRGRGWGRGMGRGMW